MTKTVKIIGIICRLSNKLSKSGNQDTYRVDFYSRLQFIVGSVPWIFSKPCFMSGYTDKVFLLSGK